MKIAIAAPSRYDWSVIAASLLNYFEVIAKLFQILSLIHI